LYTSPPPTTPHPHIDGAALRALFSPADSRTPAQVARVALDDAHIAQLQATDNLVLGVPMYNFDVPLGLKAWIDAPESRSSTAPRVPRDS
jgi:FMN-dependent NADH-azoreductase